MEEGGLNTNMNLTVRIHDKEYVKEVAQGITFTEEYNETLDSAVVRLAHIKGQITELKPYDDVYIYESSDEENYFDNHIAEWRAGGELHDGTEIKDGKRIPFYRHLLVDKFSEEIINLSEEIFSYSFELFSETKRLEMIQLPNISVTEPLNVKKKVDIYTYLTRFVNLYSPKYKLGFLDGTWEYQQKYSVDPNLADVFKDCYPQDFTLTNPSLRDVLSSLMVTMDAIPYVKDDVIYAKMISQRTGTYDIAKEQLSGRINRIVGQMGSSDYCDGVRRQYSNALSQDGICNFVEYLGFRNKDNAIMTLDNMRLETTHNIYRIKKCNICWYQKGYVNIKTGEGATVENAYILKKYDISSLIKTKEEWNLLSQDWRDLESKSFLSIGELSQYKIGTLSYSIGSNIIEGWGNRYETVYEERLNAYTATVTYLENILKNITVENNVMEVDESEYINNFLEKSDSDISSENIEVVSPSFASSNFDDIYPVDFIGDVQRLKTIFFEIEYSGFYDGSIIHSRDYGRDNIVSNDNVSSSLTLLEKDGISQKEKLNRFANKTHVMKGRLDGDNYSVDKILKLGVTGKIGADDDVIIYRREYSIFDNYILVSYTGIQNYVLKNFYTSVYAKYRTNQLMSYSESTNRSENGKVFLLLSKNKKYKNEKTFFECLAHKYSDMYEELVPKNISTQTKSSLKALLKMDKWAVSLLDANVATIGKTYLIPIYIKQEDESLSDGRIIATVIDITSSAIAIFKPIDVFDCVDDKQIPAELLKFFSAFTPSNFISNINAAILTVNMESYSVDEQTFTSGKNLCFNVTMSDNVSGGNFISSWSPDYKLLMNHPSDNANYYIGATQDWYNITDDIETGYIQNIIFSVLHIKDSLPRLTQDKAVLDSIYDYLKKLPKQTNNNYVKQFFKMDIVKENIYKDNKEKIDFTLQIEPIVENNNDIVVSEFLTKLSDFVVQQDAKNDGDIMQREYVVSEKISDGVKFSIYCASAYGSRTSDAITIDIREKEGSNSNFIEICADLSEGVAGGLKFWSDFNIWTTNEVSSSSTFVFKSTFLYKEERDGKTCLILKGDGVSTETTANDGTNTTTITEMVFVPKGSIVGYGRYWTYQAPKTFTINNPTLNMDNVFGNFFRSYKKQWYLNKNMFVEFSNSIINKTTAYKILPVEFDKNGDVDLSRFSKYKPSEIFQVQAQDDIGNVKIHVDLENVPKGTQSVNYWYFDFASAYLRDYSDSDYYYEYAPERSMYRFVFGVNITDEDIDRGYIDIYISKVTNRDERIYDMVGKQIGVIHNCIDSEGNYEVPEEQEYDQFENVNAIYQLETRAPIIKNIVYSKLLDENNEGKWNCEFKVENRNILACDAKIALQINDQEGNVIDIINTTTTIYEQTTSTININFKTSGLSSFDAIIDVYLISRGTGISSEHISDKRTLEVEIAQPQLSDLYIDPWIDPATGEQGEFRWDYSIKITNPNNFDVKCNATIAIDELGGGFINTAPINMIPAKKTVTINSGFEAQDGTATFSAQFEWGGIISEATTTSADFIQQ